MVVTIVVPKMIACSALQVSDDWRGTHWLGMRTALLGHGDMVSNRRIQGVRRALIRVDGVDNRAWRISAFRATNRSGSATAAR